MKKDDFVKIKKAGFNPVTCVGYDNGMICGAFATKSLEMPLDIPDMPMCRKHYDEASEWWSEEIAMAMLEDIAGENNG